VLDVDNELDVWRTKVSDYVQVCAEVAVCFVLLEAKSP